LFKTASQLTFTEKRYKTENVLKCFTTAILFLCQIILLTHEIAGEHGEQAKWKY